MCARQSAGAWLTQELRRTAATTQRQQQRAAHFAAMHAQPSGCGGPPSFADADAARFRQRSAAAAVQTDSEAAALLATPHTEHSPVLCSRRLHTAERGWMHPKPAPDIHAKQRRAWMQHDWEAARMQQMLAAGHEAALLDRAAGHEQRAAFARAVAGAVFNGSVQENIKCVVPPAWV